MSNLQKNNRLFYTILGVASVVLFFLMMIICTKLSLGGMRWVLCKSTWMLFAGVMICWILVALKLVPAEKKKVFITVVSVLTLASLLLLPFGLAKWNYYPVFDSVNVKYDQVFKMNRFWSYGENLIGSMLLHIAVSIVSLFVVGIFKDPFKVDEPRPYSSFSSSSYSSFDDDEMEDGDDYFDDEYRDDNQQSDSWLDHVWTGDGVSDSYTGHRGEFDLNDEARRASEDIQQFHNNHRDADLSDHYYWEDVLDADTDGYLDD